MHNLCVLLLYLLTNVKHFHRWYYILSGLPSPQSHLKIKQKFLLRCDTHIRVLPSYKKSDSNLQDLFSHSAVAKLIYHNILFYMSRILKRLCHFFLWGGYEFLHFWARENLTHKPSDSSRLPAKAARKLGLFVPLHIPGFFQLNHSLLVDSWMDQIEFHM